MDVNQFLMQEGGRSFPFEKLDDVVVGTVLAAEIGQQTDVETGEKLFWPNGEPRNQLVITLQTDLHNRDDDDGIRTVYAKGGKYDVDKGEGLAMKEAIAKAVRAGGGKGLNPGDRLTVAYTGIGVRRNRAFNAPKLYSAEWEAAPPAPPVPPKSVSARDLFGEMAEPI